MPMAGACAISAKRDVSLLIACPLAVCCPQACSLSQLCNRSIPCADTAPPWSQNSRQPTRTFANHRLCRVGCESCLQPPQARKTGHLHSRQHLHVSLQACKHLTETFRGACAQAPAESQAEARASPAKSEQALVLSQRLTQQADQTEAKCLRQAH